MNGKTVELQWILLYVDIDGNERADLLDKRGTKSHIDKSCGNIANDWKEFSHRPHKEAVANFRLKTRHDSLQNI
ncbi:hypothetical protein NPIL_445271 [Nephila pilipes]|uniref:Uncharacterized protein n=1 Tax=Nephila pilipes TaxID=299642 RepID=A0A8X6Q513_NEPPI|nr:hypothetical protein NPIL_445271 [Nephila pilipes]